LNPKASGDVKEGMMHAQHLGSDVILARRTRFDDDAEAARLTKQARHARAERLAQTAGATWAHGADAAAGLCLRSLEPTDAEHLRSLFEELSQRSRWLRYLAPLRKLSSTALTRLASIDHESHEAVGAFDNGVLIGAAHYFRDASDPTRAEISVEVADSHQRRGIGPRLLNELAVLARGRGLTEFNATALRENTPVLRLVRNSDWPSVVRPFGTEVDIALTLPDLHGELDDDIERGAVAGLQPCS
jgi:GNAT superfamily N-acetyltransferase